MPRSVVMAGADFALRDELAQFAQNLVALLWVNSTVRAVDQRGVPGSNHPVGEDHFRRAVAEFVNDYHRERNHQGLENQLIGGRPALNATGRVHRRRRLGGLLNYYERA